MNENLTFLHFTYGNENEFVVLLINMLTAYEEHIEGHSRIFRIS
jgi:hypothetical protein